MTLGSRLLILGLAYPALLDAGSVIHDGAAGKFIVHDRDSACTTLQQPLSTLDEPKFDDTPDWKETDVVLPSELGQARQADFDFYNDGHMDRVFLSSYGSRVMQGSSLLVQPGSSFPSVKVTYANPLDDPDTRFYPCQLADKSLSVKECSPFGLYHNNDSFSVYRSKKSRGVEFPVDFSELIVVRVHTATFVVVLGMSSVAPGVAAVFRPNRNKDLELVCML